MKKRYFRQAACRGAVALASLLAFNGAAAAQCEQQVEQSLQQLAVSQGDVESVQIKKQRFGDDERVDYFEYNAWIRLRSCGEGYLVIHMTDYCFVRQSYTRGDCQVSGVPQY